MSNKVVLVEGTRTPFLRSGTSYVDLMSYQLGAMAISGLLNKSAVSAAVIDQVIMGTVVHNIVTPNVAREAALTGGVPYTKPGAYSLSSMHIGESGYSTGS